MTAIGTSILKFDVLDILGTISVGDGVCEGCFSQSDSLIGSVEDRIESLKEDHGPTRKPPKTSWGTPELETIK
jgi:hypothetical protein